MANRHGEISPLPRIGLTQPTRPPLLRPSMLAGIATTQVNDALPKQVLLLACQEVPTVGEQEKKPLAVPFPHLHAIDNGPSQSNAAVLGTGSQAKGPAGHTLLGIVGSGIPGHAGGQPACQAGPLSLGALVLDILPIPDDVVFPLQLRHHEKVLIRQQLILLSQAGLQKAADGAQEDALAQGARHGSDASGSLSLPPADSPPPLGDPSA